jgi:hypothetical protein
MPAPVYPSDEPEPQDDSPQDIIDRIIERIIDDPE